MAAPHDRPSAPASPPPPPSNAAFHQIVKWPGYREFAAAYREATGLPLACLPAGDGARCLLDSSAKESALCRFLLRTSCGQAACRKFAEQLCQTAAAGKRMCSAKCFAGLLEIAVPVFSAGQHVATLTTGRVFHRRAGRLHWDRIKDLLGPCAPEELEQGAKACRAARVVAGKHVQAAACFLQLIAKSLEERLRACVPAGSPGVPLSIAKAEDYLRDNAAEPVKLSEVARYAGLSPQHFCKVFKQGTGLTFTRYLAKVRVEHAQSLLRGNSRRIADIAFECGFGSIATFNRVFKRLAGVSPGEYQRSPLAPVS